MFGLSFGEIVVLVIVGIVVLGPRRLPEMMRTAGKWVSKVRRLSTDLRAQSGIDDLIKQEGLENEIQELRSLSRINVIDTLITPAAGAAGVAKAAAPRLEAKATVPRSQPLRYREYPVIGCDSYGALADDIPPRTPAPPAPPKEAPVAGAPVAAAPVAAASTEAAAADAPGAEAPRPAEPAKEPASAAEGSA